MTTDGFSLARSTRRAIGGTARLVLGGPPLALGVLFSALAEMVDRGCGWIEGGDGATRPAVVVVGTTSEPDLALHEYKRAARVLYAQQFDTVAIAELLGESEADVAHWVCRPGDPRAALEAAP